MRLDLEPFASLASFDEAQSRGHVEYALAHGWSIWIEHSDERHPSRGDWRLWGKHTLAPIDPAVVMQDLRRCREQQRAVHLKVSAFAASGRGEEPCLAFLVHQPSMRP